MGVGSKVTPTSSSPTGPIDAGGDGVQLGTLVAGRFRVVSLLGEGTFSHVWRAHDEQHGLDDPLRRHPASVTGDTVVLKVLRPSAHGVDADPWPTVRAEIRAAGLLGAAPHLVVAEALVHHHTGELTVPCLVLPDVAHGNLAEWLSELPFDETTTRTRLAVLGDVLNAIAEIHDRAIAHRDVGFGNVLVDHTTPGGYLGDFGAAQFGDAIDDPPILDAPALRPIQPPPYGGGCSLQIEQRRDLYAFAVLATLTLVGRHPLTDRWQDLHDDRWTGSSDPYTTLTPRSLSTLGPWPSDDAPAWARRLEDPLLEVLRTAVSPGGPTTHDLAGIWPGP